MERLAAFSDGVIAIIITIMVLELKVPESADLESLGRLVPMFLSYVLSFIYVAIYWNNHYQLLRTCKNIDGAIMWANAHLLFWLSLIPFATAWMGENHYLAVPTALYGVALFMPAVAWYILQRAIIRRHGETHVLAKAVGSDWKGKTSIVLYLTAVAAAFWHSSISHAIYVAVAAMWLIPDRRIGRAMEDESTF
ncbi:hypothetical protein HYPDE_34893 [Hyphomicrobium denitrificans 1NES1]|uniref:DUF1211 domain-containing protein n=1 Tax=Hyphomicrobium denitrificans 1NES1 TaxID=670307 RepID=N0BEV2_9HYPH|nr:TMEM175 family protein [Hyphomicrobium denitrificans]AGK58650.1 hypothetical protein HYPDE_34893 [Hyphomicrobium denitrificans 1NES1]